MVLSDQKVSPSYSELIALVRTFTDKIPEGVGAEYSLPPMWKTESDRIMNEILDSLSVPLLDAELSSPPSSEQ